MGGESQTHLSLVSVLMKEKKHTFKRREMLVDSTGRLSEFSSQEKWLMSGGRAIKRAQQDVTGA